MPGSELGDRRSLILLLVVSFPLLSSGCQRHGRLRMVPITHLAVGASTTLLAYEEALPSNSASAHASSITLHQRVNAAWSVSDSAVAKLKPDGTIEGIKQGRVIVRAMWEGQQTTATVEVVQHLRVGWLPEISADEMSSSIRELKLSLAKDRTLRFHLGLDESTPAVTLEVKAP